MSVETEKAMLHHNLSELRGVLNFTDVATLIGHLERGEYDPLVELLGQEAAIHEGALNQRTADEFHALANDVRRIAGRELSEQRARRRPSVPRLVVRDATGVQLTVGARVADGDVRGEVVAVHEPDASYARVEVLLDGEAETTEYDTRITPSGEYIADDLFAAAADDGVRWRQVTLVLNVRADAPLDRVVRGVEFLDDVVEVAEAHNEKMTEDADATV